jgi:hypothetical protein
MRQLVRTQEPNARQNLIKNYNATSKQLGLSRRTNYQQETKVTPFLLACTDIVANPEFHTEEEVNEICNLFIRNFLSKP